MKKLYFLFFTFLTSIFSFSQVLSDDFSYNNGNLIGQGGWVSHNGEGNNSVMITSGMVTLSHGSGSREDVNKSFAAVTSGSIYYAFDLVVSDDSAISGTDSEYFAHFNTSSFTARVDVVPPSNTGDYTLGISTSGSTANAIWASDLDFGTTYRITVRYDVDNSTSDLWVDANSDTETSISGGTGGSSSINSFALRQSDSSSDEAISIDNLIVSLDFNTTLSSNNNSTIKRLSIFPNPVTGNYVNVNTDSSSSIEIAVYDVLGKQVKKQKVSNNILDISNLRPGIYLLRITQNDATSTKKLVIK